MVFMPTFLWLGKRWQHPITKATWKLFTVSQMGLQRMEFTMYEENYRYASINVNGKIIDRSDH